MDHLMGLRQLWLGLELGRTYTTSVSLLLTSVQVWIATVQLLTVNVQFWIAAVQLPLSLCNLAVYNWITLLKY